jgi:phenylacetate-CoA ligase
MRRPPRPLSAQILAGIDATAITSRAALASLPVTRKGELLERQKARRAEDAMGGFAAIGWRGQLATRGARRVFQSPGPIYEPEGSGSDYWRWPARCAPPVSRPTS